MTLLSAASIAVESEKQPHLPKMIRVIRVTNLCDAHTRRRPPLRRIL